MASAGKILVTGSRGQLGSDLMARLSQTHPVVGVDLPEFDICNQNSVNELFEREQPQVVIHAAARTDVDGCEGDEAGAFAVNADGTRYLAEACRDHAARLIYYSTDYVFNGDSDRAYTEQDSPDPQTVYGRSKLAGEKAIEETLDDYAILRLAWVYGLHGNNFVKTMLRLGRQQLDMAIDGSSAKPLKVVDDQVGNPTWTVEIVRQTEKLIESDLRGLFHATAAGETSWFGFARELFDLVGWEVRLEPCTTKEFPRPAPRPKRSSLDNRRLEQAKADIMRPWSEALSEFIAAHKGDLT